MKKELTVADLRNIEVVKKAFQQLVGGYEDNVCDTIEEIKTLKHYELSVKYGDLKEDYDMTKSQLDAILEMQHTLKEAFLTLLDSAVEAAENFNVKPEVIEQIKKLHLSNAGLTYKSK